MKPPDPSSNPPQPRRTNADGITIVLFVAILCAPLTAHLLHLHEAGGVLAFETAARPTWRWEPGAMARFPREAQRYFNTHFAFRDELMALHARLKVRVFGVSSSDRVTLGDHGWLFYAGERIIEDYRRTRPFSEHELQQWTQLLVTRRDWLRASGVPFLFFVAPNPQTIYPEHMPNVMRPVDRPSRLDQLITYLGAHSDLEVLDLRPALRAAKVTDQVYYQTDTHWNQLGAFVAYQEVSTWARAHFPAWRTFTSHDFTRVEIPGWHGGLSYFLGEPSLFSETRVVLQPRVPGPVLREGQPLSTDETIDAWTVRPRVTTESADGEIPSGLFFRDSQFSAPAQFLSRHFRRGVFAWTQVFDPELVRRERPSVVIQEIAERRLMEDVPRDPPLPWN